MWTLKTSFRIIFFLCVFGFYLWTLFPTIASYRDSGDMSASAFSLGIAHPPGYPLYVVLSRAYLALEKLGNIAYRLNVLSALLGAGTAFLMFRFLWSLAKPVKAAEVFCIYLSVLCLCVSPAFWALSKVSEMYTLNAFLVALMLNLLEKGKIRDTSRISRPEILRSVEVQNMGSVPGFWLISLVLGLGLCNHHTVILALPAIAWAMRPYRQFTPRQWGIAFLFFLAGTGLYLFLPIRSLSDPLLNWGEPHTLRNFWRVVTRADYGGVRLHPESPAGVWNLRDLANAVAVMWKAFYDQFGALGLILGGAGLAASLRNKKFQACLIGFLFSGPFFIAWANLPKDKPESLPILEPHLLLPNLFLAPFIAWGAVSLCRFLSKRIRPAAGCLAVLAVGIAAASSLCSHWDEKNHRSDMAALDYAKGILSSLPPGSLIIDPDDPTAFGISYLSVCKGLRPDVVPVLYFRTLWGYRRLSARHPEILPAREIRSGQELFRTVLEFNLDMGRNLYAELPQKVPPGYDSFPAKLAYRIYKGGALTRENRRRLLNDSFQGLETLRFRRAGVSGDFFTRHAFSYLASALNNLGIEALSLGELDMADNLLKRSLVVEPDLAEAWNNRANIFYRTGDYAGAVRMYRKALRLKPSPGLHYNLGRALFAAGNDKAAKAHYLVALRTGDLPGAANDLGLILFRSNRITGAVSSWEGLVLRHPEFAPGWYNLGLGYSRLGRKGMAAAAFRNFKALSKDRDDIAEAEERIRALGF